MRWKNYFNKEIVAVFLIMLIPMHVFASGVELINIDSGKISISVRNISVKHILNLIEQKSSYRFLYNDDLPQLNEKISVNVKEVDAESFIVSVLERNAASATIMDNNLVVVSNKTIAAHQDLQQKLIRGTIVDNSTGETLVGANILIKGTTTGTITDFDGNFSLEVPRGATIVVSYIGYKNVEIEIADQTVINIKLVPDGESIDEVVVVGYGVMRKSDLTASISSVKGEELTVKATTNPAEALQGRVAGVNIQKFGGRAGEGVYVKIRGANTTGSNQPLYIIDGFPGSITNVNPSDIESMEVLKDGAAAAIYGSVAANGVIIVTTKRGKAGDVVVDFNSYLSMTRIANQLDLLDAQGYINVHKMMYENAGESLPAYINSPIRANTNWQDELLRDGLAQNHSIGIRGGVENLTFSLSSNISKDKGIFMDNSYNQQNGRLNVNFKKSIFDVTTQMSFASYKSMQPNFSLKEVYMISPLVPVYDPSEEYGFGLTNKDGLPNNVNSVAREHFVTSWSKGQDLTANFSVAANFTSWLQFKTSYSYRGLNTQAYYHRPAFVADPKVPNEYPYYDETRTYWEEQVIDNVLSFNKMFDRHSVSAMVGSSVQKNKSNWNSIAVEGKTTIYSVNNGKLETTVKPGGFLDEYFMTIGAGSGGTFSGDGSKYEYNRASFFGRLNYSFADKYLVQFTMRRDGSSKFGKDNRWGNFPSIALGWRITQEEFFPEIDAISNIKLRGSWGRLGNETALGYYDFQSLIESDNGLWYGYVQGNGENPWPGSTSPAFENRTLKWETTESLNIGVDYGLWSNSLTGALNFYQTNTKDLLIVKQMPPSAGVYNPILNVGEIRNRGFEFEANYNNKKGEFSYNVGLNLSTLNNEVVSLAEEGQVLYGTGLKYGTEHFPTQTKVGKPIGSFFLYKTNGLFQSQDEVNKHINKDGVMLQPSAKPGDVRFVDTNGDGEINDDDKVYCGSGMPKLEVNINAGFEFKGFDFSFLIGSGWGNKLYNGNRYFYEGMSSGSNMLTSTLNAWTPSNTSTSVPRAVLGDPNGNSRESDRFLEKGDFIRLRNIQLGYSLPKTIINRAGFDKARLYVSGDNIYTWTKYDGIDPEFGTSSVFNTGVDNLIFPFTRSFVVGIQVTF